MPLRIIYRGDEQAGFFAHALGIQAGENPLDFLPGNVAPATVPYACLVVVKDLWRMVRRLAERACVWHYSQLEPNILDDVRSHRAVLVFDLSNEGPSYEAEVFAELYGWIAAMRLPPQRCIWLAQNRAIASAAAADPMAPDPGIRFIYYDFFVKIIAYLFSPESDEHPLGADPAVAREALASAQAQDRLLLCLNATPRVQRVVTVAMLDHLGLLEDSLVSFPGMDYVKPGHSADEVRTFLDHYAQLRYLLPAVERVLVMPHYRVDTFTETGNQLIGKVAIENYLRTFFSLVTESEFSDGAVNRITEKSAKAFCMGHPTMIVGNPGALDHLTRLGFQDWDQVFDRRIDTIINPGARFEALVAEVLRQVAWIRRDPDAWRAATREVSHFNLSHALEGRFLAACCRNMDSVAVARIQVALG